MYLYLYAYMYVVNKNIYSNHLHIAQYFVGHFLTMNFLTYDTELLSEVNICQ